MTYNTYLIPQIDDLELRKWLIHQDGGSMYEFVNLCVMCTSMKHSPIYVVYFKLCLCVCCVTRWITRELGAPTFICYDTIFWTAYIYGLDCSCFQLQGSDKKELRNRSNVTHFREEHSETDKLTKDALGKGAVWELKLMLCHTFSECSSRKRKLSSTLLLQWCHSFPRAVTLGKRSAAMWDTRSHGSVPKGLVNSCMSSNAESCSRQRHCHIFFLNI